MRHRLLFWAWTQACRSLYVCMYKSAGQHMQVTWWSSLVSSFLPPSTQPHSKCSKPRRTSYPANVTAWVRRERAALKGKCVSGAARHPRLPQRCCFWSRWMCALTCTCIDTRACMQMKMQVCLWRIEECLTQPEVGRPAPPVSSVQQQR